MDQYLPQLGIGGALAILLIREFVQYSKKNGKPNHSTTEERLREIETRLEQLHEMHRVFDKDGAPIWYRKSSEYETLKKIEHGINNLRQAMQALTEAVRVISRKDK